MNFASHILRHAEERPDFPALVLPKAWDEGGVTSQESVTYGELSQRIAAFATGLRDRGWGPGDRVVVIMPVCVDLYAVVLAVLAQGMTAVLIDTGMGVRRVLQAVRIANPVALVSIGALLRFRWVLPPLWRLKKFSADSSGLGIQPLDVLAGVPDDHFEAVERSFDDEALMTFTSGSTGVPKGADRTHGLLTEQHRALEQNFPSSDGDVDMSCFPVVALHDLCCGITVALAPVDLRKPGEADPRPIVSHARKMGATSFSGAPAYMRRLADFMKTHNERLPSVARVFVGGAPVPKDLVRDLIEVFPEADTQVVYGSTEAEPVAHIPMREAVGAEGEGHIVGKPVPQVALALANLPAGKVAIDEKGIEPFVVADGELGEVLVSGKHVLRRYVDNPEATEANKVTCPDGTMWHRTGDVGRLDDQGRLWLVGRIKDRVESGDRVLYPYPFEEALSAIDGVVRAALVAHDKAREGEAVLVLGAGCVEADARLRARSVLDGLGATQVEISCVAQIPYDPRHNSKIDRPALRKQLENRSRAK